MPSSHLALAASGPAATLRAVPPSHHSFPRRTGLPPAETKIIRLHPGEKVLLAVASALLVTQPWANGGMTFWSQWLSGALALAAFLTALIPRRYTDEHHAGGNFRLVPVRRLVRFPFFWLGLVYFAFVLIQQANPAWQYVNNGRGWWLASMDHIPWLPHGIADTPAAVMNAWRTLLIQGAVWLTVCALWTGLTRRKSVRLLVTVFALNGAAISVVILLQRLTHATKMLWFFAPQAGYFAGSFTYKNHAGEYLLLVLAACLGLGWWHTVHAQRRLEKSHPGFVFLFLAAIVAFALMLTYARAATALGGALIILVVVAYLLRTVFRRSGGPPRIVTFMTTLLGAGFVALCFMSLNVDSVWGKFERLFKEDEFASITSRQLATQATLDMARDSLVVGHGAGGFRFLFPLYQQHYPEIYHARIWDRKAGAFRAGPQLYWEHAHDDYAELLAESGLVGAGLALATLILILGAVRAGFVYNQPALLILLAGPGFVALSGLVDFPAHNPAILAGAGALTVLALRWGGLSRR